MTFLEQSQWHIKHRSFLPSALELPSLPSSLEELRAACRHTQLRTGNTRVSLGLIHFLSKYMRVVSFVLDTLLNVGCPTPLSDLVLLSGGRCPPRHQLVVTFPCHSTHLTMDSVSASIINGRNSVVCYQNY